MPSLDENKTVWDSRYDWERQGDEWSEAWGTVDAQWETSILPRIQTLISPAQVVLEIAPGFGRFSNYLRKHCERLVLVDISEKCIDACKTRFRDSTHIEYFVNDGTNLEFIEDESLDFVFSFDSLVHADEATIERYINQLSKKLKKDGSGFIHHSNMGEYAAYHGWLKRIKHGKSLLTKMRLIDPIHKTWRDPGMSAEKFRACVEASGMRCISQEIVNWNSKRLVDCFTVFSREDIDPEHPCRITRNPDFMKEAAAAKSLSC